MSFSVFGIRITINKELLFIIAIILLLMAGATGYLMTRGSEGVSFVGAETSPEAAERSAAPEESSNGTAVPDNTVQEPREIKVYVVGCVNKPGIVTIKKGQLVCDAVDAAGGLSAEADPESVNMVYELNTNVMLYIKPAAAEQGGRNGEPGQGFEIVNEDRGVVEGGENLPQSGAGGRININTAGMDELDTLPGIGEATAKDIISYREKNGPFIAITDIMKVPRIKEGRFENIKDYITVD